MDCLTLGVSLVAALEAIDALMDLAERAPCKPAVSCIRQRVRLPEVPLAEHEVLTQPLTPLLVREHDGLRWTGFRLVVNRDARLMKAVFVAARHGTNDGLVPADAQ